MKILFSRKKIQIQQTCLSLTRVTGVKNETLSKRKQIKYTHMMHAIGQLKKILLILLYFLIQILNILEQFFKCDGHVQTISGFGEEIRQHPIIIALQDSQILYHHKHKSSLEVVNGAYLNFFQDYFNTKYKQMSFTDKIQYKLFNLKRGLKLKELSQNREDNKAYTWNDFRSSYEWATPLYSKEVGKRYDPIIPNTPIFELDGFSNQTSGFCYD